MAFMKFYTGKEANAQSHLDGIYLATDSHKIFYNGAAYGGEEVDLSNYITKDDLNSRLAYYISTSGGYVYGDLTTNAGHGFIANGLRYTEEGIYLNNNFYLKPSSTVVDPNQIYSVYLIQNNGRNIEFIWDSGSANGFYISVYTSSSHVYIKNTGIEINQTKYTSTGITISGKTTSDLLNAGGSTTSISDLVSQVTAAIVDGAPTTLDTLNELAAALGDDPNFAATITAELGKKANASHTHAIGDITNLQTTLDGKAPTSHTHQVAQISNLGSNWAAALTAAKPNWLTSIPSEYVTDDELNAKGFLTKSTADGYYQAKGSYLTSVSIATISDLHANWDALLKVAPSAYVTRWPSISEVTGKTNLVIKLNGGTTEGTNQFTYNGVTAKTLNITPGLIGAAASSHTHTASQVSGLSTVATSGSYNDLSNKPSIPSLDGYATQEWVGDNYIPLNTQTITLTRHDSSNPSLPQNYVISLDVSNLPQIRVSKDGYPQINTVIGITGIDITASSDTMSITSLDIQKNGVSIIPEAMTEEEILAILNA